MAAPRHWTELAACYEHPDPDLWFPDNTREGQERGRRAMAYCASCPVAAQCLEDDLRAGEPRGIRAGLSERARRKLVER